MILFCPVCSNTLITENSSDMTGLQLYCRSCPYKCPILDSYTEKKELQRKQVEDVLGGADAWSNVDQTDATCPKCEHTRAYYMQIQIRSADEPSSLFFKCTKCGFQWREG